MPVPPITDRYAKRLDDGRIEVGATIGDHKWKCICDPDFDLHDHQAVLQQFSDDLDRRDTVLGNLQSLVGLNGTLRGATYTVSDVGVTVLGPGLFKSRVAVSVAPVDGATPPVLRVFTKDFTSPSAMRFTTIVQAIMDEIGYTGDRHVAAAVEASRFTS
jgi:hypothetical protein